MTPEQMEARVSRALDLHKDGFNCAQCVACACAGEVGMDEDLAFRMMEGFGGGMGRFDQTCGAISGGVAVLGMQRSGGPAAKPRTKGATYKLSKRLTQEFAAANGSTMCNELKGLTGGPVLRSCDGCIEDGVRLTLAILSETRGQA